jgi:6-phosphogluconolactonase
MQQNSQWHRFANSDEVAAAACRQILAAADRAIAERGQFKLVLAGGTTPDKVYRLLAKSDADWGKWFVYYGDERCLPSDHPERNSEMAKQALLNVVSIPAQQIFTIAAELGSEQGALCYRDIVAQALPFDMVLLGVGEDGHTASLFPGHHHSPDELTHAVHDSPKPPSERVSVSAKALSDTKELIFLVTGVNKQEAIKTWRSGGDLPVAAITPPVADIYLDEAAYSE